MAYLNVLYSYIFFLVFQTRHNNERNESSVDYENNIEQLDGTSDASSIIRFQRDGSQDLSFVDSPIPCRSAGSSSDGVFFSSSARSKGLDNRRFISKSQMKG